MKRINQFLLQNQIQIIENPCISPDFCLDWEGLQRAIRGGEVTSFALSRFETPSGSFSIVSDRAGDHAWKRETVPGFEGEDPLEGGMESGGHRYYPATFENLIRVKNLVQESDPGSTLFPGTEANLGRSTLGIGARFTTLHWPGVFWAMRHLGMGFTANQNSIPRELVYDVDKMLDHQLDTVPFPFIGTSVPEGHQGQSVQGMSHGCILENLKSGFHRCRLPWSFNADHQPIGGKFDQREDDLVNGCLFATYITFDLSPELSQTPVPPDPQARRAWVEAHVSPDKVAEVRKQVHEAGCLLEEDELLALLCFVWPSMRKMKLRDEKYRRAREAAFTTAQGRSYLRELSIDELPGLTSPKTTAVMLALCRLLDMPVHFVAPAFGFQKNMPYPDNAELERLISQQWAVCRHFRVSIGFHSGSGKSAENYQVMGRVTEGHLEIKTSGRYTYEMGKALQASVNPQDQKLWQDWFRFTAELAAQGAFSEEPTEREMARAFIADAFRTLNRQPPPGLMAHPQTCRQHLLDLPADPDLMFWFEYNFLFVLAAGGSSDKSALGDHSPAGYAQRRRFYAISETGRLHYCRNVAAYLIFLAENSGLVDCGTCAKARALLETYNNYGSFVAAIGAPQAVAFP